MQKNIMLIWKDSPIEILRKKTNPKISEEKGKSKEEILFIVDQHIDKIVSIKKDKWDNL